MNNYNLNALGGNMNGAAIDPIAYWLQQLNAQQIVIPSAQAALPAPPTLVARVAPVVPPAPPVHQALVAQMAPPAPPAPVGLNPLLFPGAIHNPWRVIKTEPAESGTETASSSDSTTRQVITTSHTSPPPPSPLEMLKKEVIRMGLKMNEGADPSQQEMANVMKALIEVYLSRNNFGASNELQYIRSREEERVDETMTMLQRNLDDLDRSRAAAAALTKQYQQTKRGQMARTAQGHPTPSVHSAQVIGRAVPIRPPANTLPNLVAIPGTSFQYQAQLYASAQPISAFTSLPQAQQPWVSSQAGAQNEGQNGASPKRRKE